MNIKITKVIPNMEIKPLETAFKIYLKGYLYRDMRMFQLQNYVNKKYNLKIYNILSLLKVIIDNSKIIVDNGYYYLLTNTSLKINDVKLDTLLRLVIYGNREIKGSTILQDSIRDVIKYYL